MRKDGRYRHKGRDLQTFECKSCERKFNERSGSPFARLRFMESLVVLAVMLQVQLALSARSAVFVLRHAYGTSPSPRTLQRWVRRFHGPLVELEARLKPKFSPVWMIDEMFLNRHAHKSKRKPHPLYLFTVFDKARHVVACLVSKSRDAASVERVVKKAIKKAGFVPQIVSHDACGIYTKAHRRLRNLLGSCRWVTTHFNAIVLPTEERSTCVTKRHGPATRIRQTLVKVTQNDIERYHCTPRQRENSMRGVKTIESGDAYFESGGIAWNLFHPHERHGGRAPAVAAGWAGPREWADLIAALA